MKPVAPNPKGVDVWHHRWEDGTEDFSLAPCRFKCYEANRSVNILAGTTPENIGSHIFEEEILPIRCYYGSSMFESDGMTHDLCFPAKEMFNLLVGIQSGKYSMLPNGKIKVFLTGKKPPYRTNPVWVLCDSPKP